MEIKNRKLLAKLFTEIFKILLFVLVMSGYFYLQYTFLTKNINESNFLSKYNNVDLAKLSAIELDNLKYHIGESQKYTLFSSIIGAILITYIISSPVNYIKKYFNSIKEFAKNNIVVFEYLFFGQTLIFLASNNTHFYPFYTNIFLFICSQILNLFSITQISYPRRIDNTYIKFIVNFILIMISTLIYFSTVYNIN